MSKFDGTFAVWIVLVFIFGVVAMFVMGVIRNPMIFVPLLIIIAIGIGLWIIACGLVGRTINKKEIQDEN